MILAEDSNLAGCVQVGDCGGATCHLGMLSVEPERQADGVGRQLILAAEQAARLHLLAQRTEMTVIRQRSELVSYCERRGYRRTGEERPCPVDDRRFGLPRTRGLSFVVRAKVLAAGQEGDPPR